MENKQDAGALWVRTFNKDGVDNKYLTGLFTCPDCHNNHKIAVFKNGYKKAENQPDWRIYKSTPKPEVTQAVKEAGEDLPF